MGNTKVDLCSKDGDSTFAKFNEQTGVYEFSTKNKEQIPPGHYELEFTGSIGDLSDSVIFGIDVIDPCITATIKPSELKDQEYTIYQDAYEYKIPAFETTPADCPVSYSCTIADQSGYSILDFAEN